jgi:hypothetical protein
VKPEDCKDGMAVWYFPDMRGRQRFAGTVAGEVRYLGTTPVVRLEHMEHAYGEWRKGGRADYPTRTSVPAAALEALEARDDLIPGAAERLVRILEANPSLLDLAGFPEAERLLDAGRVREAIATFAETDEERADLFRALSSGGGHGEGE